MAHQGRLFRGAALIVALAAATAAAQAQAATPPGAELLPIRGVAYQPAPSDYSPCPDCPYFDTDFFNADFQQLWGTAGGGRGDLGVLSGELGANLVRLYNWNPGRDHLGFLDEARRTGVRVAVPISNYFVNDDPNAAANIEAIVRQVYVDEQGRPSTTPHPAVPIWTVGNEFDIPPADAAGRRAAAARVARATALLVAAENRVGATRRLPVSVPVSFAGFDGQQPAFSALHMAMDALRAEPTLGADFVSSRYVAAVNTFNPGPYLRDWLARYAAEFPGTAVWFSELGIDRGASCNGFPQPCTPSDAQQGAFLAAQWQDAPAGTAGVLLGGAAFEYLDEPWKTGSEATFGLKRFAPSGTYRTVPTTRGTYRVDDLVAKPSWDAIVEVFHGRKVLVGSDGGRVADVEAADEDLVEVDLDTGEATKRLDGSDVGLRGNAIDAFAVDPRDGSLFLSLARSQRLPGAGKVGPSDVVRHEAASGRFSVAMRAASVGLGGPDRDVDALAVTPDGRLVVSTDGTSRIGGRTVRPHDLHVVQPGRRGAGRLRPYLRGSAAGLARRGENVDGAWIDPASGAVHLTTTGRFGARGVHGSGADVLVCDRTSATAACATRLGHRGRARGLGGGHVAAALPLRSRS